MPQGLVRCARASGVWAVVLLGLLTLPGCLVVVKSDECEDDGRVSFAYETGDGAWIGVLTGRVDEALASQLGIDAGRATLITGVVGGSPAERAGLRRNDVVVAVDGHDGASPGELRAAVGSKGDGGVVDLRLYREGQPLDIAVEVRDERD